MRVEHREEEERFVAVLDDGEAELAYTHPERGVIDIQHTFVPRSARGQGVAEALAEAAFQWARERGDKVVPSCPFVRKWVTEHPEHGDVAHRDWVRPADRRPS
jgi:uncharacterized protein